MEHGAFTMAPQGRSMEYGTSIGLPRWRDSSRPMPYAARSPHLRACCRTASAPRRPPWSHIVGHVVMPLVSVLNVVVVVVRRAKLSAKMSFFRGRRQWPQAISYPPTPRGVWGRGEKSSWWRQGLRRARLRALGGRGLGVQKQWLRHRGPRRGSPGALDGAWDPHGRSAGATDGARDPQRGSPGAIDGAWDPHWGSTGAIDRAWDRPQRR